MVPKQLMYTVKSFQGRNLTTRLRPRLPWTPTQKNINRQRCFCNRSSVKRSSTFVLHAAAASDDETKVKVPSNEKASADFVRANGFLRHTNCTRLVGGASPIDASVPPPNGLVVR